MMKRIFYIFFFAFTVISCQHSRQLILPPRNKGAASGNEFYKSVFSFTLSRREKAAKEAILSGNIPSFLRKMTRINTSIKTPEGRIIKAFYFVTTDYLAIGSDRDFARIPLTPITAQTIADSLGCFLPTRKIVNDINLSAKIRLEPIPMYAFRDSSVTMYQHNLIIEGQRKQKKGLIAGIKKDVVISEKISRDPKRNRVAIYGWHQMNGKPIQPLYTGHVDWYVDYSHGTRLVYRTIFVNKKPLDYIEVLKDKDLRRLLCDETFCDFYRYETKGLPQ